jgi:hypothetical protein
MKKIVSLLLSLVAAVALSVPASVTAQEPAGDVVPPAFRPSPPPAMSPSPTVAAISTASQEGEAATPLQRQLQKVLDDRKAAGLPVPSSVKFEYQATPADAMQKITGAASPTGPIKVVGKIVIRFDGPEQAGYDEWPALVVKDNLPPDAQGTVREGDYTEAYRKFMEEKVPGFWTKYEFGHEPRMHTIVETIEVTYPEKKLLEPGSMLAPEAATAEQLLMGFTYTGPHLDYAIQDSWEDPIFGIEIYYFKAGFELDWGLGLRLPGQADLTGPDQMVLGTAYDDLSSAMTPLDWSAADYSNTGVAPEGGNEFVLKLTFFVGIEGHLLGVDLCPSCHVTVDIDKSASFTTPFGPGAYFPIEPATIPIKEFDLALIYFGAGLVIDPNLGSDKITADWQASGDASGSGSITYSAPGVPVSFGPVNACNLGPGNLAQIQLNEFRYWFNEFLIDLGAYIEFELFGWPAWNPTYSIISLDLSSLTDGMYLGGHTQCDWDFTCSAAGPDNTLNLSIPVVDQTPPTTSIAPSGTPGDNDWFVSNVQVTLSAVDGPPGCGVGVKETEYGFDGSSWTVYSGPFTISDEGETTVYYRSTDNEDNVEATKTQTVKIDKTPPTITGAPTTTPNGYGWYNADVVVHFTASDDVSGIASVTPDQTLSGEGADQSVTGTAVDMAGLSASFTVTGINIDKTKPVVSITDPEAKTYENTETFNVAWTATDSLSGIATENGTLDGDAVNNGQLIELLLLAPGSHTVVVDAVDKADNAASASVTFDVSVDIDGLTASLEYMCELDWINKDGICNSLGAKLRAAKASIERGKLNAAENQLNAFINELEAQKGKAVSQQAYDVLKASALYVIEHLAD